MYNHHVSYMSWYVFTVYSYSYRNIYPLSLSQAKQKDCLSSVPTGVHMVLTILYDLTYTSFSTIEIPSRILRRFMIFFVSSKDTLCISHLRSCCGIIHHHPTTLVIISRSLQQSQRLPLYCNKPLHQRQYLFLTTNNYAF